LSCHHQPAGPRDAAFLALLYAGGLRRSEAVTLDINDYDAEAGELRVEGKGRRERMVQRMAGHAQVTTTARYDRRPEARERKAAQKLHVPYGRRPRGALHNRS
jgi:site-specific recombinase XerD